MLKEIIKLLGDFEDLTSYHTGLLQTKAYRALKSQTNELLEHYGINALEWAAIGLLYEAKSGIRLLELSETLGVEQPYVTVMVKKLSKLHLASLSPDQTDKRAKVLVLTSKGRSAVPKIEKHLRSGMRPLLKGANIRDIAGYLTVLKQILKNSDPSYVSKRLK